MFMQLLEKTSVGCQLLPAWPEWQIKSRLTGLGYKVGMKKGWPWRPASSLSLPFPLSWPWPNPFLWKKQSTYTNQAVNFDNALTKFLYSKLREQLGLKPLGADDEETETVDPERQAYENYQRQKDEEESAKKAEEIKARIER